MLKITILQNELPRFDEQKSGLSLLIESQGKHILFDTSVNDEISLNAERAQLSLYPIDFLVLSHSHVDHTQGLLTLDLSKIKQIVTHPSTFKARYYPNEGYIGCPLELTKLTKLTKVVLSKNPYWLIPNSALFLGEVPRENTFEGREAVGYYRNGKPDYVPEDSALVFHASKGLVIISGCAHAGICNIIEYAKELLKRPIYTVVGGFHLFNKEQTDATIAYFKQEKIKQIYPMHCLDNYAFAQFEKIGARRLYALDAISF